MDDMTMIGVAAATGGRLVGATTPQAAVGPDVVIDSRVATPGAVFVALAGERSDGHDFVTQAGERGAALALTAREVDTPIPQVVVADTLEAFGRLARSVVDRARARGTLVVGVTGSSGKTSTKDLISQILASAGPTVAPPGSFNNEIGTPLTACRVDAATRYLVSEMGARGPGHITTLTQITPPDIGVVLNVGHAHVGEFGSVAGIARAKGELVEALPEGGWAVLNADDPHVAAMVERTPAQLASFSVTAEPTFGTLRVWASDITADALQRHRFTLHVRGPVSDDVTVTLSLIGVHQVANAAAAAAVAVAAGLGLAQIASALDAARPLSRWRMELIERPGQATILNDAYNANPDSMAAALTALAGLRQDGGRLVAALGDMLELGEAAEQAHHDAGALAARLGVDEVVAVGSYADAVASGARDAGGVATTVVDTSGLTAHLLATLDARDVVLIKASRGLALETVAQALIDNEGEALL